MGGMFGGGSKTHTYAEQLGNMSIQTSGYGRCVPVVYGKSRVAANLIFYDDFRAIPHTETVKTGKGGGGSSQSSTTYTYTAAVMLGLCEGQASIGRVWVDKETYDGPFRLGLTVAQGPASQGAWPYLASRHPDRAVGYGSTCYVAHPAMDLGEGGTLKNHSFEATGFHSGANPQGDANPADVLLDMLTHPVHGMGFPASAVESLADYRLYSKEAGFLVSAAYEDQKQGMEVVKTLLECSNSIPVWSGGRLRALPLGELPEGEWAPNSTPLYALTCDDFLGKDDPVKVKRKTSADAYNSVKVKFRNRAGEMGYAEDVAAADDLAMQDLFGIRPAPEYAAECIHDAGVAQRLAQTMLQRHVGVRNEYRFKLGWRYALLEPGDLVTLTEPGLGLDNTPVRITTIEEDQDGEITATAEDWPHGIADAVRYPAPPRDGGGPNTAVDPGGCNAPIIFEPPGDVTGGSLQVWIGTSGGEHWGGCEVHASRDKSSYSLIGRIDAPARHGTLTASLPNFTGANPDTSSNLAVDLSASKGTLISASQDDADKWETLSYVDGELVSFQNAVLTSADRYSLTRLRRGLFSSKVSSHPANSKFMRLDDAVARLHLERWNKGETIYLKFPSFNKWGGALQDISALTATSYKIQGTGLTTWAAPSGVTIAITSTVPP